MRVACLLFLSGCQLVLPIREIDDADVIDTGADAIDAGPDGPVNLLTNGDFEQGASLCGNGWSYSGSDTVKQQSSIAHTGSHACEICATGPQAGLNQPLGTFPANTSFAFGAWFAPAPPNTTVSARVFLSYRMQLPDGGTQNAGIGAAVTAATSWQQATQGVTPTYPVDNVSLGLQTPSGSDGGCFLVDDAYVVVQ